MNLLLFYFATFFLVCASNPLSEVSLPAEDSNISYEPFSWRVGSNPLKVNIDFLTESQNGVLFELKATNQTGESVNDLIVYVSNGTINLTQAQGISQNYPDKILSDGEIHHLYLSYEYVYESLDYKGIQFGVQLDPQPYIIVTSGILLDFAGPGDLLEISISFGSRKQSVIGCLQHNITLGGNGVHLEKASSANGASEKCPTPCSTKQLNCNGGKCLDLSMTKSVCDCYGSGYSGATCDKEPINVVGTKDKTEFYYTKENSEIAQRIAFSFKLDVRSKSDIRLFSTGVWKQISETFAKTVPMGVYYKRRCIIFYVDDITKEFEQFTDEDEEWHNFLLSIDYSNRVMNAQLDAQVLSIPFQDACKSQDLLSSFINFGGAGFAGCLSDVYVNRNQILQMLNNSDANVGNETSLTFAPCPSASSAVAVSVISFVCACLLLVW